jgi:hypothetical protein
MAMGVLTTNKGDSDNRDSLVAKLRQRGIRFLRRLGQRFRCTAVERAIEFGIDITLLLENLKLTPTERIRRHQRALESVVAFQEEARRFRDREQER